MKIINATLFAVLSLFSFSSVTSAVVVQSLKLPVGVSHETNPRYTTTNQKSISKATFKPRYSLTSSSGANQWISSASLDIERTSDQSISQDRNDPTLDIRWTHSYETGKFTVTGLAKDQSTRVSELTDSGLISADNTRKKRSASAIWDKILTDRVSWSLAGSVSKISFSGTSTTGLVDYQTESIKTKLGYSLSDKTEVFTELAYTLYKPENNSTTINSKSLNLGLSWIESDKLNTNINAGVSEIENSNTNTRDRSWQASINSNYATGLSTTKVSLSRSQEPSSTGSFRESQQLTLGWLYNLTERENVALNVSWRENLSGNNFQFKQYSASYNKALSLSWDFQLSAKYNTREDNLTNASSRIIEANITYKLPDF